MQKKKSEAHEWEKVRDMLARSDEVYDNNYTRVTIRYVSEEGMS